MKAKPRWQLRRALEERQAELRAERFVQAMIDRRRAEELRAMDAAVWPDGRTGRERRLGLNATLET